MSHLRRRPKHLVADERIVYNCELQDCPTCGHVLRLCRHYTFAKMVQHLDRVAYVASRPKECRNPACPQVGTRYPSARAQTVALSHGTYGLDVITQIGWWRDWEHLSGGEIHARLGSQVQISRRQVDLLLQQYRALLACSACLDRDRLAQAVQAHAGLIISLDGLEPEGTQEQLWVVREVLTDSILAVGWVPRVTADSLVNLLTPVQAWLQAAGWRVRATVSDKQVPLRIALERVWPSVPHQWCQAHYLRNAVKPLQAQDQALKTDLRQAIRKGMQPHLRQLVDASQTQAFSPSHREWSGRGDRG